METTPEYDWHRSSYSGGSGDNCLEAALGNTALVPVRDSKNPLGPKLLFRAEAWSAFVGSLTHPA
ncbi:DUF397 domain-containing protein [Streptomyces sp. NPDC057376]|uniref:DUF397 domain-containing protein n=1 Tax=unclassified Streptomyces TaxID=2593676 RepID=UPI00093F68CD|nr:DUF397 domain-containing protein [Streptomyces sp. CB02414]OKI84877.1 toxin-antitoxin system, toxin component [Streptomyces sp. CB02414]